MKKFRIYFTNSKIVGKSLKYLEIFLTIFVKIVEKIFGQIYLHNFWQKYLDNFWQIFEQIFEKF